MHGHGRLELENEEFGFRMRLEMLGCRYMKTGEYGSLGFCVGLVWSRWTILRSCYQRWVRYEMGALRDGCVTG